MATSKYPRLPVDIVIRLLGNPDIVSGMAKLYESVSNLNNDYIQPNRIRLSS
ncbi:hypothetical protein HanRHA438_Chr12g0553221 [Helianthus annuus]|nr:hypothetical protein HanRHA438_Chr12g0553221 [Helianthus annuus]